MNLEWPATSARAERRVAAAARSMANERPFRTVGVRNADAFKPARLVSSRRCEKDSRVALRRMYRFLHAARSTSGRKLAYRAGQTARVSLRIAEFALRARFTGWCVPTSAGAIFPARTRIALRGASQ